LERIYARDIHQLRRRRRSSGFDASVFAAFIKNVIPVLPG
jgi:hypothetical protein